MKWGFKKGELYVASSASTEFALGLVIAFDLVIVAIGIIIKAVIFNGELDARASLSVFSTSPTVYLKASALIQALSLEIGVVWRHLTIIIYWICIDLFFFKLCLPLIFFEMSPWKNLFYLNLPFGVEWEKVFFNEKI